MYAQIYYNDIEIALRFWLRGGGIRDDPDKCQITVEPSDIKYPYYDEWKYSGSGSGDYSTQWGLCSYYMHRKRPNILECEKCHNDWVNNIIIDRAEKGTTIYFSEDSNFHSPGSYTVINILKNFDKDSSSVEDKYRQGIQIGALNWSTTDNKYFTMTYVCKSPCGVALTMGVSNVRVYFNHRKP